MAFELIVVGASLGGFHALETLFKGLPGNFRVPLAVVQHRHRDSDNTLQMVLQRSSAMPVAEPTDKQAIMAQTIYLAPPDYHLLVEYGGFALSTEGPILHARPSIDVLFESAADAYGPQLIGIILTGDSADGAEGLAAIKARGGCTVVQDPATAECPVMPEAALARIAVDHVVPLDAIAPLLIQLCPIIPEVAL